MIVKSMARKTVSFRQLLDYFNAPAAKGAALLQNFRTAADNRAQLEAELLDNSRYLPSRKNGNVLYHEILSFSDLDRARITPPMLEDLARYYLSLRAPYALAYAKAHFNTACPHVHVLISANALGSCRRQRLSKQQFQAVKREVERYQQARYPFLKHSTTLPDERGRRAPRRKRGESERSRRLRQDRAYRPSRKDELRAQVLRLLTAAPSGEAFLRLLQEHGVELRRRGRTIILEDHAAPGGRRYRLSTLGVEETFWRSVRQWEGMPGRIQALTSLEQEQARQRWAELGFREELLGIILSAPPPSSAAEQTIRERLMALERLEEARRLQKRMPER